MKNVAVVINTKSFTEEFCKSMEIIIDRVFNYPAWETTVSGHRMCFLLVCESGMEILKALESADCIEIRE